tara:strand:+ start:250 stop:450 length:201 start_codon:yes stop_codon:yes gene_type:complete
MQKSVKNQHFLTFFVLVLFLFLNSCAKNTKNCEIKPDLERIGESAVENLENLAETDWRSANLTCNF